MQSLSSYVNSDSDSDLCDDESSNSPSKFSDPSKKERPLPSVSSIQRQDRTGTNGEPNTLAKEANNVYVFAVPSVEAPHVERAVDYFGLQFSDEVAIDEFGHRQSSAQSDNPNGDPCAFWLLPEEDNWSKPADLWGDVRGSSIERTMKRKSSVEEQELSKKSKVDMSDNNSFKNVETSLCENVPKSPFYIHHKISPHLHRDNVRYKLPKPSALATVVGHSNAINRIGWCKADYSHLLLSASADKTVKIWNVFSEKCLQTIESHDRSVRDACWSASAHEILSCSYDKTARICHVEKGVTLNCCEHDNYVTCVSYHPENSNSFLTGCLNSLFCWDVRDTTKPMMKYQYKDKFGQVQDIAFSLDGNEFFSCGDLVSRDSSDRNIMAWDFRKGVAVSNQMYQERYTCTHLKVHPQKPQLFAQSQGNYVAVFSTVRPYKMNKFKRYEGHKVAGYNVGFDISADGQLIVSGSSDGQLFFYNSMTSKLLNKISSHRNAPVLDVSWHPVLYSTVAACTWDGLITVWQ